MLAEVLEIACDLPQGWLERFTADEITEHHTQEPAQIISENRDGSAQLMMQISSPSSHHPPGLTEERIRYEWLKFPKFS